MRRFVIGVVAVGGLVAALAGLAGAQGKNATLTLSDGSVAAGIGFRWGSGTLAYAGKTYPVKVEGLSVGEVGVTRATAKGEVSNLTKLEDFNGSYTAAGVEGTVAGMLASIIVGAAIVGQISRRETSIRTQPNLARRH